MAGNKDEKENLRPIIIKRIKKGGGGHHGGAWKVAYADFVTAMMAFFLLLWLLNVTTDEQKNAISNYFDPSHPKVSDVVSGSGGILGGMAMSVDGAMVSNVQPLIQQNVPDTTTRGEHTGDTQGNVETPEQSRDATHGNGERRDMTDAEIEAAFRKQEDEKFKKAADELKAEMEKTPELQELKKNLLVDITPEGLRIQIVDDKGRSMFPSGSAQMYDFTRTILLKVSGVIKKMSNQVSVRGHTDSAKYKEPNKYDNWNLSADRAQSSRRVLVEGGLVEARVENVMGRADRDHLLPKEPENPRNRRISIILLRDKVPPKVPGTKKTPAATNVTTGGSAKNAPQAEPKKPVGLQIIDDTKPEEKTPAGGAAAGTANAGRTGHGENDVRPLPVVPGGAPTTIQRQPQVVYFGEQPPAQDAPLYNGPVAVPYENKPPTIHKKLFNLPSDKQGSKGTAAAPAPAAPQPNAKVMTFDDGAVEAPKKPLAPVKLPDDTQAPAAAISDPVPTGTGNTKAPQTPATGGANKVLEFGD